MKRKELTKTFMMISNSMVYAKIIQRFRIKSIEGLDVTSAVSTSMRIYFTICKQCSFESDMGE